MGNKMCKKKVDNVDSPKATPPSTFDRIITRLHLKPNSWKSDSQLSTKQVNRSDSNPKDSKNGLIKSTDSLSKSSEWCEAKLEVPEREAIHLKNPQLSFIFNDNTTPTPPPRKHKKSIREKIETVAKNSIQALQSIKSNDESKKVNIENLTPCNEPICVKKVIHYGCPCGSENCNHLRQDKFEIQKNNNKKESKRKKNLSVVSLPNYTELKLSLATDNDNLRYVDSSTNDSANSLPEEKQTGKLENYMTRCRSFGSLLNNKLKVPKTPADVESDDSFGGLEDWDLGILEHYNPKDASLPRTRKSKNNANVLVDVENLIVSDIEATETPSRPVRRSESIKKKKNLDSMEESVIVKTNESNLNAINNLDTNNVDLNKKANLNQNDDVLNTTNNNNIQNVKLSDLEIIKPVESKIKEDIVEHSTLMKILQEYSIKDAQHRNTKENNSSSDGNNILQSNNAQINEKGQDCMNMNSVLNVTSDFLNTERQNIS